MKWSSILATASLFLAATVAAHPEDESDEAMLKRELHMQASRAALEKCHDVLARDEDMLKRRMKKRQNLVDEHFRKKGIKDKRELITPWDKRQNSGDSLFTDVQCMTLCPSPLSLQSSLI